MKHTTHLSVNGEEHELAIDPHRTLAEVLREDLRLTGTKIGCGGGDCGACTVILDGRPVASCLTLAIEADGREVLTVEGLAPSGEELHPIQRAFIAKGAIQCGFCTPGMQMSTLALLMRDPRPSEEEIRAGLAGNLCRCTGYNKIVEAVAAAAEEMAAAPDAAAVGRGAPAAGGQAAAPTGAAQPCGFNPPLG